MLVFPFFATINSLPNASSSRTFTPWTTVASSGFSLRVSKPRKLMDFTEDPNGPASRRWTTVVKAMSFYPMSGITTRSCVTGYTPRNQIGLEEAFLPLENKYQWVPFPTDQLGSRPCSSLSKPLYASGRRSPPSLSGRVLFWCRV